MHTFKYDVAISFAVEDMNAALALSLAFELRGVKNVYYYPDCNGDTAGKILRHRLKQIYGEEARYIVILASAKYFKKDTAQFELNVVRMRMERDPACQNVLLVKLERELPLSAYPFLERLAWLEWNFRPKEIADVLLSKLGTRTPEAPEKKGREINIQQSLEALYAVNQSNTTTINF